jgi:hypothetical protein
MEMQCLRCDRTPKDDDEQMRVFFLLPLNYTSTGVMTFLCDTCLEEFSQAERHLVTFPLEKIESIRELILASQAPILTVVGGGEK